MIYILNKVGYSAGVYGCSGEYFTLTIIKDSEDYKNISGYHRYGQLKGEERKGFKSEREALKEVEEFIK